MFESEKPYDGPERRRAPRRPYPHAPDTLTDAELLSEVRGNYADTGDERQDALLAELDRRGLSE